MFQRKCFLIGFLVLMTCSQLLAGPGGKIAKHLSDTPFGKVVMVLLVIVLFPLIIYSYIKGKRSERTTQKDLKLAAKVNDVFNWLGLKPTIETIFLSVHKAWTLGNMEEAEPFMTDWYWQNQQIVFLDKWKKEGLINRCDVREVLSIKPIYLWVSNDPAQENSRVVVRIEASMEDYLERLSDGQVIEGIKGYKDRTTIWTFKLVHGKWLTENIEQDDALIAYRGMRNELGPLLQKS